MDARALTNALVKLGAVQDDLPAIARQASSEARAFAVIGVNANVYSTRPGAYQRTQALRARLYARQQSGATFARVTVGDRAPYAAAVELGQGPNALSPAQVQAISGARPPGVPVQLGRSGEKYTVAGPFIAPAQAFSLYRMKALFAEAVRRRV